jgi:NAD(P)-dependent dehydrogenase (short-subunit alcohol dehydrogenase family)
MDLGLVGRVGAVTGADGGVRTEAVALLREEGAEVHESALGDGAPPLSTGAAAPGDLDFLVNFTDDAPGDDPRAAFERRVMAPLRTLRAIAPALAQRGGGRVVNVVPAGDPVTGAAALALTRLFADRYAARGVLVNALAPTATADPAAVAREIAFLCSARASHIAGTAGVID